MLYFPARFGRRTTSKYFATDRRLWDENLIFCLTNHRKLETNVTFMSMTMSGCWFIPPGKFKTGVNGSIADLLVECFSLKVEKLQQV